MIRQEDVREHAMTPHSSVCKLFDRREEMEMIGGKLGILASFEPTERRDIGAAF